MEYYSVLKRSGILTQAKTLMKLEGIVCMPDTSGHIL